MVLYEVVPPHKCYYNITFRDIPEEYILGGCCIACGHTGPVNRYAIEGRWSRDEDLRVVDDRLRCIACGNRDHNTFMVFGRRVRKIEQKPMPATVEFGEPPPEPSFKSMVDKMAALYPPVDRQHDRQVQRHGEAHGEPGKPGGIPARGVNDNAHGEEISDRNQ